MESDTDSPAESTKRRRPICKPKKLFPVSLLGLAIVVAGILPVGILDNRIMMPHDLLRQFPISFLAAAVLIWLAGIATIAVPFVWKSQSNSKAYTILGGVCVVACFIPFVHLVFMPGEAGRSEPQVGLFGVEFIDNVAFVIIAVLVAAALLGNIIFTHYRLRIKDEGVHMAHLVVASGCVLIALGTVYLDMVSWGRLAPYLTKVPMMKTFDTICILVRVVAFFMIHLYAVGRTRMSSGKMGLRLIYGTIILQMLVSLGQLIYMGYQYQQYNIRVSFPVLSIFHALIVITGLVYLFCLGSIRWLHEGQSDDSFLYISDKVRMRMQKTQDISDIEEE